MNIFADSHVGRVRQDNQDVFHYGTLDAGTLALVCDGMGGMVGGGIASAAAADAFFHRFSDLCGALPSHPEGLAVQRLFNEAVYAAGRAVFERSVAEPSLSGMGTTLTAVFLTAEQLYYAQIGDSRAYLFRNGTLRRLTRDDSFVQAEMDAGRMTEEEARRSDKRHLLTRALGTAAYAEFSFGECALMPADRILLCSDGLTGHYTDEEIAGVLSGRSAAATTVHRLIDGACARGGRDNVTVLLLDL